MKDKERLVRLIQSHEHGVAVEHGEHSITYGTLASLIDGRAAELAARGASGSFVAVERRKSPEFIVDYLSVFAVGGTVVPLDTETPVDRRKTFLELARPEFLLRGPEVIHLGGDHFRDVPADGAFVYFTSGSTGVPKPVLGSASALRSFIDWFCPEFGVGPHDRFAFVSGVSFEASLRDIFPPLAAGATLVLPEDESSATPEEAVAWLARKRITVVTVVPSVARAWMREARTTCPAVRAAFFLGEPLTADVVTGWPGVFPETTVLVNSYGSTESGQGTIYKRVEDGTALTERVPAGRPVPRTRYCFIDPAAALDADLVRTQLDRAAEGGEIVIAGPACSHGYLGMPEENATRFVSLGDGVTAYRTGDLGRVDENGNLVVIGRVDDEVKINGVRVHPAEVMRAIREHSAVADVFVTATQPDSGAGGAQLTAYVVPAGDGGLDIPELRGDLTDVLPLAMIPSRFVEVAELPTTRTGKIDRAALVELAGGDEGADRFVAPSGEVECWLADQFSDLLGVERVSAADDFFALGGDSIAATRLSSRIWQELDVNLSARAIFGAATVTGIATAILEQQLLSVDPDELGALLDAL